MSSDRFRGECDCKYQTKKFDTAEEAQLKLDEHIHAYEIAYYTRKIVGGSEPVDNPETSFFRGECNCDYRTKKSEDQQKATERILKHFTHEKSVVKYSEEKVSL